MNTRYEIVSKLTPELETAIAHVQNYLAAMEARNLDKAQTYLSSDVSITMPGSSPMGSLAEIVTNSAGRYSQIGKHITKFEASLSVDGSVIVYCTGTLYGKWLDGQAFSDIRFIDRFELRKGLITRQEVWNDSAEHRLRAMPR